MTVFGAFESTHIHGSGIDVLETTRHLERWRYDLDILLAAGVRHLRYPIPWHRIERTRSVYDFSWIDGPMDYMRRHKSNYRGVLAGLEGVTGTKAIDSDAMSVKN